MTASDQPAKPKKSHSIAQVWWRRGLWPRFLLALLGVALLQIEPEPRVIRESVVAARRAAEAGDYDSAIRHYRAIYEYSPWGSEHLAAIAHWDLSEGRYAQALEGLNAVESLRPLTPEEIGWRGTAHAGLGEFEQAVRDWEQAWKAGGLQVESLSELVNYYVSQNAWEQAVIAQQSLIAHSPADAELYYRLALMQAIHEPAAALQSLSQSFVLDAGILAKSEPLVDVLEDNQVGSPDIWYAQLGVAYLQMGELQLSEHALNLSVGHNPAYGEALAYLAYVRDRRAAAGIGAIQQALALAPDNATVQYLAGLIWKGAGESAFARRHFAHALEIDAQNPAFAIELARSYQIEGDLENAETWFQYALMLTPENEQFQIVLLQFYVDEGFDLEGKALPLAQTLVERFPENAEVYDALGWAYFQLGDIASAEESISYALELAPELARAHFHKGTLYELDGQLSFALWHYERAAEYDAEGAFGALATRAIERLTEINH